VEGALEVAVDDVAAVSAVDGGEDGADDGGGVMDAVKKEVCARLECDLRCTSRLKGE